MKIYDIILNSKSLLDTDLKKQAIQAKNEADHKEAMKGKVKTHSKKQNESKSQNR
tara:strand:- start:13270 stop:13434 length:165 start_codon:yes stop_codon:yes gene_type:complete